MKLLSFPYLDALAACVSSHHETDASSIECQMASFSLKHDKTFGTLESSIAAQMSAEVIRNRDRATSISSILSAGQQDPLPSPPRDGDDDYRPDTGNDTLTSSRNLSPTAMSNAAAARLLPVRTLATLIAMLNESFPDFNFE